MAKIQFLEMQAQEPTDIRIFREIIQENLGGRHYYASLLGLKNFETLDLIEQIEKGLSYKTFERFQKNSFFQYEELAKLVHISTRTLGRRRKEGKFTFEESNRLLRISRLFGQALELFEGDVSAARTWFSKPAPSLGNRTPQEMSTTDVGANEVENLIGRLEHGVFS